MPQGLILPSVGLQQDTNMYAYSNGFFYPLSMQDDYEAAKSWPDSFVEVSEEVYLKFTVNPPQGKMRGADVEGMPCWVDVPPLTSEELSDNAARKKIQLLNEVSAVISTLQDAVDLNMATDEETANLQEWKKYRVLLSRVDVKKPVWPPLPETAI